MTSLNSKGAALNRLVALVKPHARWWWISLVFTLGNAALGLWLPFLLQQGIDDGIVADNEGRLLEVCLLALLCYLALFTTNFIRSVLVAWLGQRVITDLRQRSFRHLIRHAPGFFHVHESGELLSRLTSDITMLRYAAGTELALLIRYIFDVSGAALLMLWLAPDLALLMLATLPPLAVIARWLSFKVRKEARKAQDEMAAGNSRFKDAIVGIETVQIYNAEQHEERLYMERAEAVLDREVKVGIFNGLITVVIGGGTSSALVALLWLAGRRIIEGTLTAGEVTSLLALSLMLVSASRGLAQLWGNIQRATGASERVFELLAEDPEIQDGESSVACEHGRLTFRDVTFCYPSRPEIRILDGLNLDVNHGEHVALVGTSGAGKTTISGLVQRFYDPQSGQILLDDRDLRSYKLETLRSHMATVRQEPVIFADTLRNNIAYAVEDVSDEAIYEAVSRAHLKDFIDGLPDGLNTEVGERGVRLSGGQRQRVAIARAILANPTVLILDEATSHLDSESERVVNLALSDLMAGRTTLVIAHRLSTIRAAKRIILIDNGRVLMDGTHEQLLAQSALYRQLTASREARADDQAGHIQTPESLA